MHRGRIAVVGALLGVLLGLLATAGPGARSAAANHDDKELEVVVALNAAGRDRISVRDATFDTTSYVILATEVAVALDRPVGSFRASEDVDGGFVELTAKLAQPDRRGGLSYTVDTGKLQLLAQHNGYDAVILVVCAPKVRQIVDALVAPQSAPYASPGSRCRGWYQPPDEPAFQAVVQLLPDRQRYPAALLRVAGAFAISFGVVGIGATLLRRGPLQRRSLWSWLLSTAAVLAIPMGWGTVTLALWASGAAADPVLLGGRSVGDQVARTLLPGLIFVVPALAAVVILLSAPGAKRSPPAPPGPVAAPPPAWWPAAWWQQWAAQGSAPPRPPPTAGPDGSGWSPPPS